MDSGDQISSREADSEAAAVIQARDAAGDGHVQKRCRHKSAGPVATPDMSLFLARAA